MVLVVEGHDGFDVACVWEEVEGLDFFEDEALGLHDGEVADLGGGVAGDVDDASWGEGGELVEEFAGAAFARGVDDDGGLGGWEVDLGEDGFGVGGEEGGVGDVVELCVLGGVGGGGFGDFDAGDLLEVGCEAESEEAGAAVGVYEEVGVAALGGALGDEVGEFGEDEGVVLEEVAGEEGVGGVFDLFADGCFGVGFDAVFGGAEEDGGAFFVGWGVGVDFFANLGECLVNFAHGDGALWDVDEFGAATDFEEADGADLLVFWFFEMGGNFGAVVPDLRGAVAGLDWEVGGGHVLEEFADLSRFPFELCGVGEVLVLAAAALGEEWAEWGGAVWGGLEDFEEVGVGAVFVVAVDASADAFAWEAEGGKDDPAVVAGDALTEVGEGVDGEFDFLVVFEGEGVEFFGWAWCAHGVG